MRIFCITANDESGFTLVELLACAIAGILLALIMGAGIKMATDTQQSMTSAAEEDVLMSTLSNAISEELRYARNPKPTEVQFVNDDGTLETANVVIYDSPNFGKQAQMTIKNNQLYIRTKKLGTPDTPWDYSNPDAWEYADILPSATYGKGSKGDPSTYTGKYALTKLEISYDEATGVFTVTLRLRDKSPGSHGATVKQTFNVQQLNSGAQQEKQLGA